VSGREADPGDPDAEGTEPAPGSTGSVVRLTVPADEFVLDGAMRAVQDATFECERLVESGPNGVMPFLRVRGADREVVGRALADDPSVERVVPIAEFDGEGLYRVEWTQHARSLLDVLTGFGATVLELQGTGGRWSVRLVCTSRESLAEMVEFCERHGFSVRVESVRAFEGGPGRRYGLTASQVEALKAAYRSGYYAVPGETSLQAIADELGISHQALSERLKRAYSTLIDETLIRGEGAEEVGGDADR
jgi:hypothetical protein